MRYNVLLTVAAGILTASALPAPKVEDVKAALLSRDLGEQFQGLPSCQGKENDPTWAKGASRYKDNSGISIAQDCQDNMVQITANRITDGAQKTGYFLPNACFTDYILVGYSQRFEDWKKPFADMNCPTVGTCTQTLTTLNQTCDSVTISASTTVTAGFSAGIEGFGQVTGSVAVQVGVQGAHQVCVSQSVGNACQWTDGKCHTVWTSKSIMTVYGYQRRVCNSPADATTNTPLYPRHPNSPDPGYYTHGMRDFVVDLPAELVYDCNGPCDTVYSRELPKSKNNGAITYV